VPFSLGGALNSPRMASSALLSRGSPQDLAIVLQDTQHTCVVPMRPNECHLNLHGVDDAGVDLPELHQVPVLLVLDQEEALLSLLVPAFHRRLRSSLSQLGEVT
jgi:hypothetical protein